MRERKVILTQREKRELLSEVVELLVRQGYSILEIMGRPLSYFDYDKVKARIKELKDELD